MTRICSSLRRLSAIVPLAAIVLTASAASAQSPLGSAQSFAVLGASTVTNTGATVITGDVGVSPGTAITGFLPPPANVIAGPGTVTFLNPGGLVHGTIRPGGDVAAQAHVDAVVAYARLKGLECRPINNLHGQVLGTAVLSLDPGVYCFDSSAQLTGTLYLTGNGPWIFQIPSTLTTASDSKIVVVNAAGQNCSGSNVFWQVGSSATLGTGTQFVGNILALASITLNTSATVDGSAIALTAAVTMDTNVVSVCSSGSGGGLPPEMDKCGEHHDKDGDHHDKDGDHHDKDKKDKCNQGVGNGPERCDPGNSNNHNPSNDERGGKPGDPGRKIVKK